MGKTFTESEVIDKIKEQTKVTSLRQVAAKIGITPGYLSDIINGNRAVSEQMAYAFGFTRHTTTTVVFHERKKDATNS